MLKEKKKILVSACLLGISCKYDCSHNRNAKVLNLLEAEDLIPVCPEQLGGLPSPRVPSEQRDGKVFSQEGADVTSFFVRGAQETLKIAQLYGIDRAVFKQRSPSCGVGKIYDGSFSGKVVKGDGIATAVLKSHGIRVVSEEDL